MQDAWLSKKADEIQTYADRNDLKRFYDALKTIYGPTSSHSSLILDAGGKQLIIDKALILKRWADHFSNVLNNPSIISDEAIAHIPQVPFNSKLDVPPSLDEVKKAVQRQVTWGGFHTY
jgi:hypothetical protein